MNFSIWAIGPAQIETSEYNVFDIFNEMSLGHVQLDNDVLYCCELIGETRAIFAFGLVGWDDFPT